MARAGHTDEAVAAYDGATELTSNPAERDFLERQRENTARSHR
jgi:predicted RNA polymerase sigma factor